MYGLAALALVGVLGRVESGSMISISTFSDFACDVPSTTARNVSIPLDECIVTLGMQSFELPRTPCSGGGVSSVQNYAWEGSSCSGTGMAYNDNEGCWGADLSGDAFGSVLFTCTDYQNGLEHPVAQGTTTITVASAVAAATNAAGSSGSSGSSSSNGASTTPASGSGGSSGQSNTGGDISGLSLGAKIGIGIGGAAVVLAALFLLLCLRRHPNKPDHSSGGNPYPQRLPIGPPPMSDDPSRYGGQMQPYQNHQGPGVNGYPALPPPPTHGSSYNSSSAGGGGGSGYTFNNPPRPGVWPSNPGGGHPYDEEHGSHAPTVVTISTNTAERFNQDLRPEDALGEPSLSPQRHFQAAYDRQSTVPGSIAMTAPSGPTQHTYFTTKSY